jgi:hypothetical protein
MRKTMTVALVATTAFTIFAVISGEALAEGEFPLAGTFTRDIVCRGDGNDPAVNVVKITPQEIVSSFGVCAISDVKRTGNKISLHTSCTLQSGALVTGDVVFTLVDDKTINIDDLDRNYHTKLSRCPISTAKTN